MKRNSAPKRERPDAERLGLGGAPGRYGPRGRHPLYRHSAGRQSLDRCTHLSPGLHGGRVEAASLAARANQSEDHAVNASTELASRGINR